MVNLPFSVDQSEHRIHVTVIVNCSSFWVRRLSIENKKNNVMNIVSGAFLV
jgi:hypothetical protein